MCSSDMSSNFHRITCSHIPEDSNLKSSANHFLSAVATISQVYVSNFTVVTAVSQSPMLSDQEVALLLES
jgi:hypothetical protein